MIRRVLKNLTVRSDDASAPEASRQLETDGWTVLRGVLDADEVAALSAEVEAMFAEIPPERAREDKEQFRYELLNRGAACQAVAGHPRILETIEPLLAEDCHVIANTAWLNPVDFEGGPWHCDAGPHVPRPEGVPWDDRIPYPIFAVAVHVMLRDCSEADGPTAIVPGSHRSGRLAPFDQMLDEDLTYDGRPPVRVIANAGDIVLFVSDVWHRGLPAREGARGRFFIQVHYGRRDIAQRIRTTDVANQLSDEAIARATDERSRALVGLHESFFYDS
jgi:ectoine hydroxylase-related dioxygenase (phytanoyl-CoA dioxygenase family)